MTSDSSERSSDSSSDSSNSPEDGEDRRMRGSNTTGRAEYMGTEYGSHGEMEVMRYLRMIGTRRNGQAYIRANMDGRRRKEWTTGEFKKHIPEHTSSA